jgi:hypothetical protein
MQSTEITIIDKATLGLASDVIRDGEFADSDFSFDESERVVTLTLWKADDELAYFEPAGLFGGFRMSPMRRLVLTFNGVQSVHFVEQSRGAGNHPLGGIRWDDCGTVLIDTYDGITIELAATQLEGQLEVTDEVDRSRIQRSRSLGRPRE